MNRKFQTLFNHLSKRCIEFVVKIKFHFQCQKKKKNSSRILKFFCLYNSLLCIFDSMNSLKVWKKHLLNSSSFSISQTIKLLNIWFLEKYSLKKVSNVLFFKYKIRDFMWKKRSFNYNYIELLHKKITKYEEIKSISIVNHFSKQK
jgi:hypothetical protein